MRRSRLAWPSISVFLFCATRLLAQTNSEGDAMGLREGWRWRVVVRAVPYNDVVVRREARVTLSAEKGWVIVRRTTDEGDLEWQIVLARASDLERPQTKINEKVGTLEVRYRGYFIRDGLAGRL